NLKQIGLGMQNHHDSMGTLPWGAKNNPAQSWTFLITPYLEQLQMYNAANMSQASTSFPNMTVIQTKLSVFLCPSDPLTGAIWLSTNTATIPNRTKGNYVVNWGNSDYAQNMTPTDTFAPANLGAFNTVTSIRGPFRVNNTTTAILPYTFAD